MTSTGNESGRHAQGLAYLRWCERRQSDYVDQWYQPKTTLLFELLRALDDLFVSDLLVPPPQDDWSDFKRTIMRQGVNGSLRGMLPAHLGEDEAFPIFRSPKEGRSQADEFLFQAGVLQHLRRLGIELRDGMHQVSFARDHSPSKIRRILELQPRDRGYYSEWASRRDREWLQNLVYRGDRPAEVALEERHGDLLPELERRVSRWLDWGIAYTTSEEIDDYFLEWGRLYLRRMWGQDLLALDDRLGPDQYNEYLGVLVGVVGRAQKHLCYASILKRRHPELDTRNLLTTFAPYDEFVVGLTKHLQAEQAQVERILASMILSPDNVRRHTKGGDAAWAPIVRSTRAHVMLPLYGTENVPFRYMLRDLKGRFPQDWFEAANRREARWQAELQDLFVGAGCHVAARAIDLRRDGRVVTDIDAVAYDIDRRSLAVFQLKWQEPVGLDERARSSAHSNFVQGGTKWTRTVLDWIAEFGLDSLSKRIGFDVHSDTEVQLFIVGRYHGAVFGAEALDERATWCDWTQLVRQYSSDRSGFVKLGRALRARTAAIASEFGSTPYALPVRGSDAVIVGFGPSTPRTPIRLPSKTGK